MILDFSFYLFVAVVTTGFIWLLDSLFLAKNRKANLLVAGDGAEAQTTNEEPVIVEYAKSFFPVLLIVFVLRGFIVEPFRIPSGSMLPTLYIGDFILVNKFAYGVKLPVLNKKIIDIKRPKRGDVVVFRYPKNENQDYIKRVIGLPGDKISYQNKVLYVNGAPIKRSFLEQYTGPGQTSANTYQEKLGDIEHQLLLMPTRPNMVQGSYVVPQGNYFVMGDNRDNSNDSRYWGTVPEKNLVGKAFMIWMHYSDGFKFGRIGNWI